MNARLGPAALLCLLLANAAPGAAAQQAPEPPAAQPTGQAAGRAGAGTPATGVTRYVIEQLMVNVNSAADGSGTRVGILKSGDKVELLERSGEAAHVRLANGRDGWVRGSYLMEAEPLRVQLAARTAEVASLRQQLQALSAPSARSGAAPATGAPPAAAAPAADVPASDTGTSEDSGESHGIGWGWLVVAALVCLGAGFAIGWLVLDARIRRRYGGLRIY